MEDNESPEQDFYVQRSSKAPWLLLILALCGAGAGGYLGFREHRHRTAPVSKVTRAPSKTAERKNPARVTHCLPSQISSAASHLPLLSLRAESRCGLLTPDLPFRGLVLPFACANHLAALGPETV